MYGAYKDIVKLAIHTIKEIVASTAGVLVRRREARSRPSRVLA